MSRLVFFDLDGTILSGLSSENRFILYLFRKGYLKIPQVWNAIIFIFRWLPTFKHYVFIKNKAYLKGLTVDAISTASKQFVENVIPKIIRPALIKRIEQHHQANDRLFLITGAPSFLAHEIKNYLGIEEVESTRCVTRDGKFTSDLPTQHPFGKEKLALAKKICEHFGADIKEAAAYGNAYNDRILLAAVGQPVAVTPDRWLRKIAKIKGWEILD